MKRRRTIKEKKSYRLLQTILLSFCLIGTISIIYIIFFSPLLKVASISVKLSHVNCVDEQGIKNATNLYNKWIFSIDSDLGKTIQRKSSCINSVFLRKILPNKIELDVFGRQPVAIIKLLKPESTTSAIFKQESISSQSAQKARQNMLDFTKLDSTSSAFMVDSQGVIFGTSEVGGVPTLYLSAENLKVGQSLEDNLVKNAILILAGTQILNVNTAAAKIVGDILATNSEPKLLFSLDRDAKLELASLQLILEEAKMEDTVMEFVDLRFNNPVVQYIDKKKVN